MTMTKQIPDTFKKLELAVPDSSRLFFASDTHFGHLKLTSGYPEHFERTRKYVTTDEMDADIVKCWNETVSPEDFVVFLGDLQMCVPYKERVQRARERLASLNGQKFLLRGNHDELISEQPEFGYFHYAVVTWRGRTYLCQHHPFGKAAGANPYFLNALKDTLEPGKTVLVHGHTHSELKYSSVGRKDFKLQNNVSWEVAYAPIPAEELTLSDRTYVGMCEGHQIVGLV